MNFAVVYMYYKPLPLIMYVCMYFSVLEAYLTPSNSSALSVKSFAVVREMQLLKNIRNRCCIKNDDVTDLSEGLRAKTT